MPGPSNGKRKGQSKRNKRSIVNPRNPCRPNGQPPDTQDGIISGAPSSESSPALRTPSPMAHDVYGSISSHKEASSREISDDVLFRKPFIYDPGNGPRVRDLKVFMSSFFAQAPTMNDPLCAEFAQAEVLQMLSTILPEETALILWYNKSRSRSRVCPACQRLYRLGDILPDLLEENSAKERFVSPQLLREQIISGLCSPVCFVAASFNYPGAIKSAWGRMGDEMDDEAWDLLNGPTESVSEVSRALGMLVRMTRLHDLGLAQLCFDSQEAAFPEIAEMPDSLPS